MIQEQDSDSWACGYNSAMGIYNINQGLLDASWLALVAESIRENS